MSETMHLALPFILPAQAQKHVTHNAALLKLDTLLHLAVKDRDLATPPATPAEGDRYIVAASPTGDWTGHVGEIAAFEDGAWGFHAPKEGWCAFVEDEGRLLVRRGGLWVDVATLLGELQNLSLLGVRTTADTTNRLAVRSNAILYTALHAGDGGDGDIRFKVNKEGASDTASLLYQTGFSGRAELGLAGDDDFHLKVSPDGSAWTGAILVDRTTGQLRLDHGRLLIGPTAPLSTRNSTSVVTPLAQIAGTSAPAAAFLNARFSASGFGPQYYFLKGRGGTIGDVASVQDGDELGAFSFAGMDGVQATNGAILRVAVDGTPGASSLSCRFMFLLSNAGATPVEKMRISADGSIQLGGANTVITAARHFVTRQYANTALPSVAAGEHVGSSDIAGALLGSDGTSWLSPGVKRLRAVTANTTVSIPAGWAIEAIHYAETAGNAVTGGVRIGTTSGGTDVVAAQAVGASSLGTVASGDILKRVFSRTVAQTLHVQAVTAWNSASLELSVMLRKAF
ncbi:MAG: DUF2793 domain-containing protein [Parvibaculaceae bacterium]